MSKKRSHFKTNRTTPPPLPVSRTLTLERYGETQIFNDNGQIFTDKKNLSPRLEGDTSVPFIRTFPSGETRLTYMDRGPRVYALACKFIAHGGRFLVRKNERLLLDLVAIVCSHGNSDDATCVAMVEDCPESEELFAQVDWLIASAVDGLDRAQSTEDGVDGDISQSHLSANSDPRREEGVGLEVERQLGGETIH